MVWRKYLASFYSWTYDKKLVLCENYKSPTKYINCANNCVYIIRIKFQQYTTIYMAHMYVVLNRTAYVHCHKCIVKRCIIHWSQSKKCFFTQSNPFHKHPMLLVSKMLFFSHLLFIWPFPSHTENESHRLMNKMQTNAKSLHHCGIFGKYLGTP